jgi:hypothetical protein
MAAAAAAQQAMAEALRTPGSPGTETGKKKGGRNRESGAGKGTAALPRPIRYDFLNTYMVDQISRKSCYRESLEASMQMEIRKRFEILFAQRKQKRQCRSTHTGKTVRSDRFGTSLASTRPSRPIARFKTGRRPRWVFQFGIPSEISCFATSASMNEDKRVNIVVPSDQRSRE